MYGTSAARHALPAASDECEKTACTCTRSKSETRARSQRSSGADHLKDSLATRGKKIAGTPEYVSICPVDTVSRPRPSASVDAISVGTPAAISVRHMPTTAALGPP